MATIKVLIVEDSAVVASILKDTLEADRRVRVVGIAPDGQAALKMLPELSPDLVTMDVWMPVLDGFATVEWIMANYPTPILVITSSKLQEDVQVSLRMLAAGALDVMEKPSLADEAQWQRHQTELIAKIKLLAGVRLPRPAHREPRKPKQLVNPTNALLSINATPPPAILIPKEKLLPPEVRTTINFPPSPHFAVIAIASSTGGPSALMAILKRLPANLPSPVLIVQHISDGFTQGLVDWLQREVVLKLRVADDGEMLRPGQVLFAPDRADLVVRRDLRVRTLREGQSQNFLRPNGDILMESVAAVFGSRTIGLVLTGMGNDGAEGLKAIYDAGGYTIAQDKESSLIYGMPQAAVNKGGTREVLPLANIADRLINLLHKPGTKISPTSSNGNSHASTGRE